MTLYLSPRELFPALKHKPDTVIPVNKARNIKTLTLPLIFALFLLMAGCDSPQQDTPATPSVSLPLELAQTPTHESSASPATEIAVTSSPSVVSTTLSASTPTVAPRVSYVVQSGDTLGGIALQFGTTVEALLQANDLSSADLINVGETLVIAPDGGGIGGEVGLTPGIQSPAATERALPTESRTSLVPPSMTPASQGTEEPVGSPVSTSVVESTAARPTSVVVNGFTYDAYNPAVIKKGQWYHYTCEFDAAWIVLKTYGFDVSLEKQVEIVGVDKSIEPYYKETANGIVIYGGDVTRAYSGDYKTNFLARSSGQAMSKVFQYFGLQVTPVHDRAGVEAALLRGDLIWIKTTVDFKPWKVATWILPDGRSYKTVLGNDHAMVVMGFNSDGVVVRDPLGPTSTGATRKYEYNVPWAKFLASWGAQGYDGLAVAAPTH